jgi:Aldehyde dehydrogenase family
VISLEDWALIRHLHRSEGLSQRAIARQLSIARDTVASALASDGPPKYEREAVDSAINTVEPRIRALLSGYPQMPATVIAERVGWTGSISWFRERVRAIRPEYLPADPVDRLEHPPGRVIQCDLWFPAPKIAVGFGQADAVRIANDSVYGLGGTVFSADTDRAKDIARQVHAGTIGVNGYPLAIGSPFGGVKDSGLGSEFGPEALNSYQNLKSMYING